MSDELRRFVEGFERLSVPARIRVCKAIAMEPPLTDDELKAAADFCSKGVPPEIQSLWDRIDKAAEECWLSIPPTA